jgi:hypothetical protein
MASTKVELVEATPTQPNVVRFAIAGSTQVKAFAEVDLVSKEACLFDRSGKPQRCVTETSETQATPVDGDDPATAGDDLSVLSDAELLELRSQLDAELDARLAARSGS